jgi:ABC-2 type transport system ATP-binding protein
MILLLECLLPRFYRKLIRKANDRFDSHLAPLKRKGKPTWCECERQNQENESGSAEEWTYLEVGRVLKYAGFSMLEAFNLSKSYNGAVALAALKMKIEPGEIFCLLGANGAGKTTTINLFLNFIPPTSGTAIVAGLDVVKHPLETKKFLAYIPEQVMLYGKLTGVENLEYFTALAGERYSRSELLVFLTQAGLPAGVAENRVATYSKGMRQKVGIAIAIAKKAKALLLDEPTSGLDPKAANEFSEQLKSMSDAGAAVLMTTHDLFRAKESGTRVGMMKHGHLVQTLRTQDIAHSELEQIYLEHMRD